MKTFAIVAAVLVLSVPASAAPWLHARFIHNEMCISEGRYGELLLVEVSVDATPFKEVSFRMEPTAGATVFGDTEVTITMPSYGNHSGVLQQVFVLGTGACERIDFADVVFRDGEGNEITDGYIPPQPQAIFAFMDGVCSWTPPATDPFPPDGATNVPLSAELAWKTSLPGCDLALAIPVSALHFGTNPTPPTVPLVSSTYPWYDPDLEPNTTYYWRVDTYYDGSGQTEGPLWSFSTGDLVRAEEGTWGAVKALYR